MYIVGTIVITKFEKYIFRYVKTTHSVILDYSVKVIDSEENI